MLTLKNGREILSNCKSKDEVKEMFMNQFGTSKAIRLIKKEYNVTKTDDGRTTRDDKNHFLCDNCQTSFSLYASEQKGDTVCPHCGFKAIFHNRWNKDLPYVEQVYQDFSDVVSKDGEIISPSIVLYEETLYNGFKYRVMRRFNLIVEYGEIKHLQMYRCLIVGTNKIRGGVLIYENPNGKYSTSDTGNPREWFNYEKYNVVPHIGKYLDNGETEYPELDELADMFCEAKRYYEKSHVEARKTSDEYPVDENLHIDDGSILELFDNYFIMRFFKNSEERHRWIYSYENKLNVYMSFSDDEWIVDDDYAFRSVNDMALLEHKDELRGSFVDKLGLFKVLGDGNEIFNSYSNERNGVEYLVNLIKYPIIESLAKVGLLRYIRPVFEGKIKLDDTAKCLWRKLKLSKYNYKLLFQIKCSERDLERLQELTVYDEYLEADDFKTLIERFNCVHNYRILELMKDYKISFHRIIEYLIDVEDNQGFFGDSVLEHLLDYYSMFYSLYCKKPKGNEEKFPDSLKKCHDVVSARLKKKEENDENLSFKDVNKKWKKLLYKDKNFTILMPESKVDLDIESDVLGHCVHSYSSYIRNGRSIILFLRRTNDPKTPFFTMEYDGICMLKQIRGKGNKCIEDISDKHLKLKQDLISFLLKWGKKNGIETGFEDERTNAA
mgnify:CR=1 FL=1